MSNNNLFYQESMKVSSRGLMFSYLSCLIVALIFGYVYSAIIIIIPVLYINFIFTLGFGLTLGTINRLLVRVTHNRYKRSQLIQAFISGLLANYFQWTAYILYAYNGSIPSFGNYLANLHWIIVPHNFFGAIAEINNVGLWSIFGVTFNGLGLSFVWLIEALIITALPITAIYHTQVYPYSELLGKWYPKYTLSKDFELISTTNKFIQELQMGVITGIQNLRKGFGHRHTKIQVFYLKDEEKDYLTFENIIIEKMGRGKTKNSIIINNFEIDNVTANYILDNYKNKLEKTNVI